VFKINFNKQINEEIIYADYYCSIFQINEYIYEEIASSISKIECYLEDPIEFRSKIADQTIVFFKNNFLSFVLVHEFEIAKSAGILEGQDEEEIFKFFIQTTNSGDWLEYFFEKYPVLQTRIENFINNSLEYINYFISKIDIDFNNFRNEFGIFDKITDVMLFLGDLHSGNKFVLKIIFKNDETLYFKPRNFKNEIFFSKVVSFFNSFEANIDFMVPKALSGKEYCWVEGLEYNNNFSSDSEVSNYYNNLGKLMFVFHLLGTTDIIPDNLIISNNSPGFFDLECLITKPRILTKESLAYMLDESVTKIGMLPDWMINNTLERDILSSTFFALNSQKINTKVWKKNNENFEYITSTEFFSDDEDKHLPNLNNLLVELNIHELEELINGFTFQYRMAMEKKDEIKTFFDTNVDFSDNKFRIVLHPTSIYTLLYREISIPEYLQGKIDINFIVENIVKLTSSDDYQMDENKLVESIKEQLYNLDIPYFWHDCDKGILYDGQNKVISDKWQFNPSEFLIERVDNLSCSNLRFQSELIKKSCEFALEREGVILKKDEPFLSFDNNSIEETSFNKETNTLKDKLLNSAIAIGEMLNNSLFKSKETINWISKVRDPLDGRYTVSLLNYDLYDGQTGIALFYLYLYKNTRTEGYRENAIKLYKQLESTANSLVSGGRYDNLSEVELNDFTISPYSFPMSFVYLSVHTKAVVGEGIVNWKIIEDVLDKIFLILPFVKKCDYLNGISGLIDFLLNMKKEIKFKNLIDKIDAIIDISISKIIAEAEKTENTASWVFSDSGNNSSNKLGGFSHGTAGISYVLFKSSFLLTDSKLKEIPSHALNYDRSFYDDTIRGWQDSRELGKSFDSTSWCHGSGGIGLGRLLTRQYYSDHNLNFEIEIAKENLLNNGFSGNQCICHGDFGNLEILKAMNTELSTESFINNYLDKLCDQFSVNKNFKCGDGGQMELLGLFMGYSGFGYQMLRFYDWENTPSVLCLETPNSLNHEMH
jgi:type 2 lantibiotic biosynthesis protein LanM